MRILSKDYIVYSSAEENPANEENTSSTDNSEEDSAESSSDEEGEEIIQTKRDIKSDIKDIEATIKEVEDASKKNKEFPENSKERIDAIEVVKKNAAQFEKELTKGKTIDEALTATKESLKKDKQEQIEEYEKYKSGNTTPTPEDYDSTGSLSGLEDLF